MDCGRVARCGRRRPRPQAPTSTPGRRLRVLTLAAGALGALLAGRADAAGSCTTHAPLTLSTACGDLCGAATACLAFNASSSGSSSSSSASCSSSACVVDAAQACAFHCLSAPDESADQSEDQSADESADEFTFLVTFGSYQSAQEAAERKRDGDAFAAAVAALNDDTNRFPSASNDLVAVIGALDLDDSTTHFTLAGGPSASDSVKYKVAHVTFAADALASRSNVTAVTLRNLALSTADASSSSSSPSPSPLELLPAALPLSITNLTLANALLPSFPSLVANFSALLELNLDMNDITAVAGTEAILSLRSLSMQDNALQVFRPVFPHLETLHLERNNLSDIPAAVFVHSSLRALYMAGNPLSSPAFTEDEAAFLASLDVLDLSNADFADALPLSCCNKTQRAIHNLTVCITDTASDDDSDDSADSAASSASVSASSVTAIVVGSVGGAVLLVILVVAGAWLYLARTRHHYRRRDGLGGGGSDAEAMERRSKWMLRESLFGGGVSPPLGHPSSLSRGSSPRQPPGKLSDGGDEHEDDAYSSGRVSTRSTRSNNSSGVYSVWGDPELLSLQVRYEDIEDIGTIGSGAFGVVFLVRYRQTQLLASKRLRADQVTKQRTQDFVDEIKMVSALDHPNVVRFMGAAWTIESNLQALFEYMENGDLRDYLLGPSSARHWSQELLQLAVDVAEALVYVHSFTPPLLHRDLKSRNILLAADMTAKVTDFGAARYKSMNDTMTAGVGTGRWLAPEVIQGQSDYDQSADVFSFGVVLSEMDSHAVPYDHVRGANGHKLADIAILQMVATGQLRPAFSAACPPELRLLALRCMAQAPADRPPAHVVAYELRTLKRSLFAEL